MRITLLKLDIFALQSFYHLTFAVIAVEDCVVLVNIIIVSCQFGIFLCNSRMLCPQFFAFVRELFNVLFELFGFLVVNGIDCLFFLIFTALSFLVFLLVEALFLRQLLLDLLAFELHLPKLEFNVDDLFLRIFEWQYFQCSASLFVRLQLSRYYFPLAESIKNRLRFGMIIATWE